MVNVPDSACSIKTGRIKFLYSSANRWTLFEIVLGVTRIFSISIDP